YSGQRLIFDADSHVMELPDWLPSFADAALRERLHPLALGGAGALAEQAVADAADRKRAGTAVAELDATEVLGTKGWAAIGSFDAEERSRVLDVLGFSAQLVFPTFAASQFVRRGEVDLDLLYDGTDALNRAMAAFCDADSRLLAVATIPWAVPARTIDSARRAVEGGCAAVMVPTDLPRGVVAPTHPDHDPLWELLEQANVPVVSHIGGGGQPVRPGFHDNGRPVTDFLGGGENVRSKDFLAIQQRPEVFWGAMVLDGIFDRFPGLMGASVEEGAMWVVTWMRRLDLAMRFGKSEPPLRDLRDEPSAYVHRHLRFTPFPGEPVGWMIEQAGDDLFMFSSDYPHPEGTRDPIARFEATLDVDEQASDRFYSRNFADLYHDALPT
ncbi:MAG: amidohydrolase family protein, partial [Ilumatobacteraceae bacterium]